MNNQIIFVDSSVENYQIFAQNAAQGSKVVILDDQSSAIAQITQSLAGESDLEALHIISHGSEGSITLGTEVINGSAIEALGDRLKQWGKSLTKTGDILLYGCNVAAGDIGKKFVKKLSEITGAGVAASNNLTGAAALGGDWNLEVKFGEVETQPLSFSNYGYTLPATITNVTSSLADGTYSPGQVVPITVTFSEPVNVSSAPGFPGLILNTGGTAIYVSGSGTANLLFNYTTATNENSADLDYTSTVLNGTISTVSDGSAATLTLPTPGGAGSLGANKALIIDDGIVPTAVNITSTTTNGSYTTTTTAIPITVEFSEIVNVTGIPTLTLGGVGTPVNYTSGTGTKFLTFNYTPVAGDTSADLEATAIAGTIADIVGNAYALGLPAAPNNLATNKDLVIDTAAPTVALAQVIPAATVTGAFNVTATFNETVAPTFDLTDITVGNGAASNLTVAGNVYTFTITPTTDGAVTVDVAAAKATDAATNGNTAAPQLAGITADLPPTITNVTSGTADGSYNATVGTIPITVTFSKIVNVTGAPTLTLAAGVTGPATFVSGSGTNTLTFNYTVGATDNIADLDYGSAAALALNGGTINSALGTAATLTLPAPAAAGSLGANKALVIDTTVPTITGITSTTADGSYTTTATIPITVTFSEVVNVTGTPTLTLGGGVTTAVNLASGAGTNTLTFNYTPAAGDTSADLDATLLTGTIADAAGNAATLTLPAATLATTKALVIDTTAPTVALTTAATVPVTGTFSVAATFTEASGNVLGFDVTDLTVGNGTISNFAGSGVNYTFDIKPTADGPVTIDVAAGKATDAASNGNTAAPTLLINANVPPKVTSVTSTLADGSYPLGQVVPITVTFSESVIVTGTPTLTLNSGGTASYASGTGTNTLTFNYTVGAGQTSADLDYTAITSLVVPAGASITDAVVTTSNADTTLPAPAAINSLGANKAIVIDTTPPIVTINQATTPTNQLDPTTNGVINYTVAFSEPVKNFDATDITFSGITGATATITGDAQGQNYNVAVTGFTQPGTLTATVNANGATDLAGNGNTASTSTDNQVTFTPVTPYVTAINKVDPDPTTATTVNYTVTFNEDVTGVDATDFTLVTTGVTGATIGTITGSGKTYNVPVNTGTLDGTVQLDLVDDNTIINALNAPLGGTALKDGDFKGQVYTVGKNIPPVVASVINDQSATINTAFSYTVPTGTFTDANSDPLTYTATLEDGSALPTWLTFDTTTGVFSGTPATADIGNLKVEVIASDGQASASNVFILTVSDKVNTAPVVASAITDKSAIIDTAFNFIVPAGTFTDAESDPLTYTATLENGTALPTWLTFNAATLAFSGTPALANVGNLKVKLTANDGKASTSDVFQLVVNGPAPIFTPTPAPAPSPSPSGGGTTTTTTTGSNAIVINTPPIGLIGAGDKTNLPQNQAVDGSYLLTDRDDSNIPTSAFGQPIRGLSGNDNLTGSGGTDTIYGDRGADIINGGDGNDQLFGGKESDQLFGGNGDDFLSGNNDNDTLTGGAGNDILRGGKENDVLLGGDGDDELWGDRGFDVLTGGAGKDNFVLEFTATSPDQADVITDFNSTDDKIKLVGFTFSQLSFESVNVILDGATAVASTVIKSGNNYLGVVYNVNSSALSSSSFL